MLIRPTHQAYEQGIPVPSRIRSPISTGERTHGRDPRPVEPGERAKSTRATREFSHDTLDSTAQHAALLGLAEDLGLRLRTTGQVTKALTLTVRYADRTTTNRSRTLKEATQHSRALAADAHALLAVLGLQRARVRAFTLRAEGLSPAADASAQLSFEPTDEHALALETVADRIRARYGSSAVQPATLATPHVQSRSATRQEDRR
ncbi:hypothetical protein ACIO3O_39950 [Streptomyces sp. NPDC087440]|uniref:DinB/UmuC family translesion DNA polymerase n=1 Tax=Streptomyces sp. NPDC087440 TaxID=3365790 RepID=UPI003818CC8A